MVRISQEHPTFARLGRVDLPLMQGQCQSAEPPPRIVRKPLPRRVFHPNDLTENTPRPPGTNCKNRPVLVRITAALSATSAELLAFCLEFALQGVTLVNAAPGFPLFPLREVAMR